MSQARRMMQQALQESLDRRDNGGPAGRAAQGEPFEWDGHTDLGGEAAYSRDGYPSESSGESSSELSGRSWGEPLGEPPVSVWAAGQLQRAL